MNKILLQSSNGEISSLDTALAQVKTIKSQTEQDFINHGMDDLSLLDPSVALTKKQYIQNQSTVLGVGKTFEQPIDLNRYKANKVVKMGEFVNLIPAMTSDTIPSGIASASSQHSHPYPAWKAFDGDVESNANGWIATYGVLEGWLQYTFPTPTIVDIYRIRNQIGGESTRAPKDWTFEGSNDGITWTVLDTIKDFTFWVMHDFSTFSFKNTTPFYSYRINITANNGSEDLLTIGELEMCHSYNSRFLIQLGDGSVKSCLYSTGETNIAPVMSSNSNPSPFVVSASGELSSTYSAWKAFNSIKQTSDRWMTTSGVTNGWLKIDLGDDNKQCVGRYVYYLTEGSLMERRGAKNWKLEGSNDDVNWDVLDTQSNVTWKINGGEAKAFEFINYNEYRYYRLNVSSTNGETLTIGELELFKSYNFMKSLPSQTEANLINHGMDKTIELDLHQEMTKKSFIEQSPTTLGSGKVFKKSIDTLKLPIKGVSIK